MFLPSHFSEAFLKLLIYKLLYAYNRFFGISLEVANLHLLRVGFTFFNVQKSLGVRAGESGQVGLNKQ